MVPSVLQAVPPAPSGSGNGHSSPWVFVLIGVVLVAVGGVNATSPRLSWRMRRWQYKNPDALEPSSAALLLARAVGVLFVVVGIVMIVVGATR